MTLAELAELGFELDAAEHARLAHFVELLLSENQVQNLTAIRTAPDVWRKHICDALALLPLFEQLRPQRVVDLGSGGGLPGLPLACVLRDMEFTLIDATAKKIAAVARMAAALGLSHVHAIAARAEVLGHDAAHREAYDVVLARAVGAANLLVEWSSGLLRIGGQCWILKSVSGLDAELTAADRVAKACGLAPRDTYLYRIAEDLGQRAVAVYEKERRLKAELPRPPWKAKRKPLV